MNTYEHPNRVPDVVPDSDKEDAGPTSAAGGLVVAPKQMSSALGSLLANYGSMSDSEAEEAEGEPTGVLTVPFLQMQEEIMRPF